MEFGRRLQTSQVYRFGESLNISMEHQSQHLVRSHRPHELSHDIHEIHDLNYPPIYDPVYLPQDMPQMYLPYPMFESPGLGLTSEHSTPCRFGDVFPNEPELFHSPWLDNYYPVLDHPMDHSLDHGLDHGLDDGYDPRFEHMSAAQVCRWSDCREVFRSMDDMIRHVVDGHIGSGKSSYMCMWRECKRGSKAFPKRHKMLNHFRTHTGEKPFQCRFPTCQKSFSRPDSLATHVKTHSEVRPYACPLPTCGRKYYHSRSLRKHLIAHAARPSPYQQVIANALASNPKPQL